MSQRLEIGKATLVYDGSDEIAGRTCSGRESVGVARRWNLVGIPGALVTIADLTWSSGERDVRCVDASGPVQLLRLLEGLRLCVRRSGDKSYVELKIARIDLSRDNLWSSLYKTSVEDLAAGSGVADPVQALLDTGAETVGKRSAVIGDQGPSRGTLALSFSGDTSDAPAAAYVLTRLLPLLNVYSAIHLNRTSVEKMRRVYVVELDDGIGSRNSSSFPNVYVGETGRSPEDRFETHRAGGRTASRKVTLHGVWLRP
ncbi:MAG: hypothetical protein U9R47_05260, partial [Actinomycetota bacterium]|nr:hypothetical protein [Actinomycetota bacterium]